MVELNKIIFNIIVKSLLFSIFTSHYIFTQSKIVIPFSYYNNNVDSFIDKYMKDILYSEIQSGSYSSSGNEKKMTIFLNLKNSNFLISTRKVCPQTSYYNKDESTSYKYENKISYDSFYFYTDVQASSIKKFDEVSFCYSDYNKSNNICGDIGFNMVNIYENEKENIIYSLKSKKYINSYDLSFKFNEKKAFDNYENLKGVVVIGAPPHEYNKNEFYIEQFKSDNAYIISLNEWRLNFDKIYVGLKDSQKTILKNSDNDNDYLVSFEISYGLITGPDVYLNYIESNFFNKSEIENLCKKSKEHGNNFDYDIFVCENNIKTKFNLFPEISLYYANFDYNFTFNYEDLFMFRNNKYYFKIVFLEGISNLWRFGLPFFLKYRLVFNQDKKQIGFYDDNIKIAKDTNNYNNSILKNIWFWIILAIVFVVIIIGIILISKKIFGKKKRQKKANELNDDFDYDEYSTNNNNDNDNHNKNILFKSE